MLNVRAVVGASVLALVAPTLLLTTAGPASAATTCPVFLDVNKDGHDDVAVGSPGEDVSGASNAGTVTIAYGDGTGTVGESGGRSLSMTDLGFGSLAGDRFGATVLTADLNGDNCGDLVVGAPGRSDGAGVVIVVFGQPLGQPAFGDLTQVLKQGTAGVGGKPEAGDGFGSALAVTGANGSGDPTELWVGVPGEDLGSTKDAGMVVVFPTSTGSLLPTSGITSRQQGAGGVSSKAEAGDRFGAALAGSATSVLVGSPGEDVGSDKDAGMFHSFVAATPKGWTADTAGVPGAAEPGDQLGASLAIMDSCVDGAQAWAVGAPRENVGSLADAGNVALMDRGTGSGLTLQQGSGAIGGKAEAGDRFGATLAATGARAGRIPVLAIGAPLEDAGSTSNAGAVTTLTTSCPGGTLTAASVTTWTQSTAGVPGTVTKDDRFGASLGAALVLEGTPQTGALDFRLLIGIPGEDEETEDGPLVDAGMVLVLPATAQGYGTTGSTLFGQNSGDGPTEMPGKGETGDGFGSALDAANAGR